ncbi:ATP25 ATPase synthesis protein 25 [Candida maltosa Xu316]|uniref:ATPase synthesis protein 25 n=1 Tax=Candida maltosa (strain Xu316) TaxID=1245528 RepID=M3HMI8_CANMX|nr:hypothetical protein G210_0763 [Candida maltosa Xu316]
MLTRGRRSLLQKLGTPSRSLLTTRTIIRTFHSNTQLSEEKKDTNVDTNIPWYLREENSSPQDDLNKVEIPELPESAPETLSEFVNLLANEYGLTDFEIFDLSELPDDHPKSTKVQRDEDYIILSSGKSDKHIFKAASELKYYIKHNFNLAPFIEGMSSNGISKVTRRRLAKRVSRGPPATHSTYGIGSNSWISCHTNVDGIVIHILSPERRTELNLEQLYSENPDYEQEINKEVDRDHIFFGIKRQFHTSTRLWNASRLDSIYDDYLESGTANSASDFKKTFDSTFTGKSIQEYNKKFDFYKALHATNPQLVTSSDLESVLTDKFSSIELAQQVEIDWTSEITGDIIKYMEFLVDEGTSLTPEEKLTKLSKFIADITPFDGDKIHLFSIDKFKALLWRLTYNSTSNHVDASLLRDIVESKGEINIEVGRFDQSYALEKNIRELLLQFGSSDSIPLWLREQMMHTYAQSGNWKSFWREWQALIQLIGKSEDRVYFWVTTIILLSKINDRDALRILFTKYWNNDSKFSFVKDFANNKNQFNSDNERIAFKQSILGINKLYGSSTWTGEVAKFAEHL